MRKFKNGFIILIVVLCLSACTTTQGEDVNIVLQTVTTQIIENPVFNGNSGIEVKTEIEETAGEKPKTIYRDGSSDKDGYDWIYEKVQEGTSHITQKAYDVVYDQSGNVLSRTFVPDAVVEVESTPTIWETGGDVEEGNFFYPSMTRYGSDCGGCYANEEGYSNTASGVAIGLSSVRQADGTWLEGYTYEGYHVVATTQKIPMCTIMEITNHKYSGGGIEYGEPFQVIVLDRGVGEGKLDLFAGSEKTLNTISVGRNSVPKAEIIGFGEWTRNSLNQRICKVD